MILSPIRTPVRMSFDFGKRVQKDVKKLNKIVQRIQKESETRRQKVDEFVKSVDKLAREDVDKVKSIWDEVDEVDTTIDVEDFEEVDGIVTFKND